MWHLKVNLFWIKSSLYDIWRLAQCANKIFTEYFPQARNLGHPLSSFRWLPICHNTNSLAELEVSLEILKAQLI